MHEELIEFILARVAEEERMAHDATGRNEAQGVSGGDHWHWVSVDTDVPVDLTTTEWFACEELVAARGDVSLRSIEEYPTRSVGPLPSIALIRVDDLRAGPARHLAHWDPHRALAACTMRRLMVEYCRRVVAEEYGYWRARALLAILAWPDQDHPDWRAEWLPDGVLP